MLPIAVGYCSATASVSRRPPWLKLQDVDDGITRLLNLHAASDLQVQLDATAGGQDPVLRERAPDRGVDLATKDVQPPKAR